MIRAALRLSRSARAAVKRIAIVIADMMTIAMMLSAAAAMAICPAAAVPTVASSASSATIAAVPAAAAIRIAARPAVSYDGSVCAAPRGIAHVSRAEIAAAPCRRGRPSSGLRRSPASAAAVVSMIPGTGRTCQLKKLPSLWTPLHRMRRSPFWRKEFLIQSIRISRSTRSAAASCAQSAAGRPPAQPLGRRSGFPA